MKKTVLFMLLCGLPLLDFAQDSLDRVNYCNYQWKLFDYADTLCNDNPWILVFEDDFIGQGLDKSVWFDSLTNSAHLRPSREQQYYTFDGSNYEVANGKLYLITDTLDYPQNKRVFERKPDELMLGDSIKNLREFKYTSSNIETIKKFSNGRFEARVKLPIGKGFWPAFWLLNTAQRYNELDIFEFMNEDIPKTHIMTSHFESVGQQCSNDIDYNIDFSREYNDFMVDWDRNKIAWYVNGSRKWEQNKLMWGRCIVKENTHYYTHISQPEDPMRVILNLAIQGNEKDTINSPNNTTPFPSKLRVDWVRVWYRMDLGNIVISTPSQCSLDEKLFNAVTGNNITIDCDYVVPRGQQLSLSASGHVILKSGFVAEAGSVFNARSKQPIYDDRSDKSMDDEEDDIDDFVEESDDNQIPIDDISTDGFHLSTKGSYSSSNGMYVYPNPNNGSFHIQLPNDGDEKYFLSIVNVNGICVYSKEAETGDNLLINIFSLPKGIYMLRIINNNSYVNLQKIIII